MDLRFQWAELQRKYDDARFEFINVELDLAITFCQIAASATNTATSERNIENAERAFRAAACFLDGNLNAAQDLEIEAKLDRFRSLRMSRNDATQSSMTEV